MFRATRSKNIVNKYNFRLKQVVRSEYDEKNNKFNLSNNVIDWMW